MVHKIICNAFQTQTHHKEMSFTHIPNTHNIQVFHFKAAGVRVILHFSKDKLRVTKIINQHQP